MHVSGSFSQGGAHEWKAAGRSGSLLQLRSSSGVDPRTMARSLTSHLPAPPSPEARSAVTWYRTRPAAWRTTRESGRPMASAASSISDPSSYLALLPAKVRLIHLRRPLFWRR